MRTVSRNLLLVAALAAVVGAGFWQCLRLPFVFDDWYFLHLYETSGYGKLAFARVGSSFYRPVGVTVQAAMWRMFGDNPVAYHLAVMALHALTAFMAAKVITHVTGNFLIGCTTALIYAAAVGVHMDILCWSLSGAFDLSAAILSLTAIWLFLNKRYYWSAAVFAAGLLCKESIIGYPLILAAALPLADPGKRWGQLLKDHWKHAVPFVVIVAVVAAVRMRSGSPLALPESDPYATRLWGPHIASNAYRYVAWMFQAFYPFGPTYSVQFKLALGAAAIVLTAGMAALLTRKEGRAKLYPVVFLAVWVAAALAPLIFLLHHSFRFFTMYSLPAFIGAGLYLVCALAECLRLDQRVSRAIVLLVCGAAVAASVFQANRVFREGLDQQTLSDAGTNLLIARAVHVETTRHGLQKHLPQPPPHSVIVLDQVDLSAFRYQDGVRNWYHDPTLWVCDLKDVFIEGERVDVRMPAEVTASGPDAVQESRKEVAPENVFAFERVDTELRPIPFDELKRRRVNWK